MGKLLTLGKSAYFGKWKISHLRYSLYRIDSSIIIELFVYNCEMRTKNCLKNLKNSPALHNFSKIIKNELSDSMLLKIQA